MVNQHRQSSRQPNLFSNVLIPDDSSIYKQRKVTVQKKETKDWERFFKIK